jgi:ZIP family zinc transporter
MLEAFTASLIASLATGLGAVILLVFKRVTMRVYDVMIGFSAGVMASAAVFSLIIPGIEQGGLWRVVIGFVAGALIIFVFDIHLPELFKRAGQEQPDRLVRQGLLMAGTVTLHNIPEGFAIGAGYASGEPGLGLILAIAIALQDVPEGTAVAAPLMAGGANPYKSVLLATASGFIEPFAALAGYALVKYQAGFLPFGLGFAAGAMLYAVSHDLLPESHSHGFELPATWSFLIGFLLLLILHYTVG